MGCSNETPHLERVFSCSTLEGKGLTGRLRGSCTWSVVTQMKERTADKLQLKKSNRSQYAGGFPQIGKLNLIT